MADVTVKRLEEFETIWGGFRRVRAGLGVSSFGIAVMEFPPRFRDYPTHDQAHDGQEEVYTALAGEATLSIGTDAPESVTLEPGVWVRVGSAEKRSISTGERPAKVLAVGATPGRPYVPPDFTEQQGAAPPLAEAGGG